LKLDVYDTDATTYLGTLTEAFHVEGFVDLRIPGTASFNVDIASSGDLDLLLGASRDQTRRWVRFRTGATPGAGDLDFAVIVQDIPADVIDIEPEPGRTLTTVAFQCPGALSVLGYREGGAALYPYGGIDGEQQNPRYFGPMSWDFPDVSRPEPTVGGTLTRAGWPDSRTERFVPDGPSLYRRILTGVADRAGNAAMWMTSASWTEVEVYFDGRRVPELRQAKGSREIVRWFMPYDGEDHLIFFDVKGTPPSGQTHSLGWVWASVEDEDDEELGQRLFSTFHTSSVDSFTAPAWQAWENYSSYPGVTVGLVADVWLTEAQDRGLLEFLGSDFDWDDDSDDQAWVKEFSRGFRVQKGGQLVDSLSAFRCEPHVTPEGTLRLFQQRGTDKSVSVTVTSPFSLALAGRGVQATRLIYETDGGFGTAVDAAAEAALGAKLEDVAQFGEDLDPDSVLDAVLEQLAEDAKIENAVDVSLPDDIVPGVDVWVGDTVSCESHLDGTSGPVRLTAFRFEVDNDTGHVDWSAIGEPV
jgi:hypothetical protein